MNLERGFDGLMGSLFSWLTQPPIRSAGGLAKKVEAEVEKVEQAVEAAGEAALEAIAEVADAVAEKLEEPSKTVTAAPKKAAAKRRTTAKKAATPRKRAAPETASAKKRAAPKKKAVPKKAAAPRKRAALKKAVAAKVDLDRFVEGAEQISGGTGDLEERLLAELAASAQGATLTQLHGRIGGKLAALRQQLSRLQKSGRVRRGKGMGTRYHLSQ